METKKKVLVIEPHSDDGVISIGGTLIKFKDLYDCHFVLITASDSILNHDKQKKITREIRIQEFEAYVKYFNGTIHRGENDVLPLDQDAKLDMFPKYRLVNIIEGIIHKVKPNILISCAPSFHQDHTAVYEAVIAATRPTSTFFPDELYFMENPTYVHSLGPQTEFKQDTYIILTEEQLNEKINCYKTCFPSQMREDSNYLSSEGIRSWARYRGIEARSNFAEALQTYIKRL